MSDLDRRSALVLGLAGVSGLVLSDAAAAQTYGPTDGKELTKGVRQSRPSRPSPGMMRSFSRAVWAARTISLTSWGRATFGSRWRNSSAGQSTASYASIDDTCYADQAEAVPAYGQYVQTGRIR